MSTQIKLKRNNRPTKPGFYLCQRNQSHRPDVAEVRKENDGLWMLCNISIFPVDKCEKDALWSDEISFVLPKPKSTPKIRAPRCSCRPGVNECCDICTGWAKAVRDGTLRDITT